MQHFNSNDIMLIRDSMEIEELRTITNTVKNKFGIVYFKLLFEEMGFKNLFNDVWIKSN